MTVKLSWKEKPSTSSAGALAYLVLSYHKLTKPSLWVHGLHLPSQELIPNGLLQSRDALVASLRACSRNRDLCTGISLHDDVLCMGLLEECSDALVTMYANCGMPAKGEELLDMRNRRDLGTWTALIASYVREGQAQDALCCYDRMYQEGLVPNAQIFSCILKACGSIGASDKGEQIHDEIIKEGLLVNNVILSTALVSMYAKCGALPKARQVLNDLPVRSGMPWNALIAGYVQHGKGDLALKAFEEMQHEGHAPDGITFICMLKACGAMGATSEGLKVHDAIDKQGLLGEDIALGNALVDMYVKCGALEKARQVLQELPVRDVISWSTLIIGYAQQGKGEEALNCFEHMQEEGLSPDAVSFICALGACGSIRALGKGEKIHESMAKQGMVGKDLALDNALLDMYVKCGALGKARRLLGELRVRNVISWSTLIAGYAQHGEAEQSILCFEQMKHEGLAPNLVTFINILNACASIGASSMGEKIHKEIANQGLLKNDVALGNALVHMYVSCGALAEAQGLLEKLPIRDVISWSALIKGYVKQGDGERALSLFELMQREGLSPDAVTFICILKACGRICASDKGAEIHDKITELGLLKDNLELGNALVDMYVKCNALEKARQVLLELPARDAISWNSLIAGYAYQGEGEQALTCLEQMQCESLSPSAVTFLCILKACGSIGAYDKGEQMHNEIYNKGLLADDLVLGTAVVDMYAQCGAIAKARQVLGELPVRNAIAWNALMAGCVRQNKCQQALNFFEQLQHEGLAPDAATFVCVLNACSRLGLVEDAQVHLLSMVRRYSIKPGLLHWTCMVDLFGRVGQLDRAVGVIEKLPSCDNTVWVALLGACEKWVDVNLGRWAFAGAVQADKRDASAYVLMANIFTAAGMQEDAKTAEVMMVENEALKK